MKRPPQELPEPGPHRKPRTDGIESRRVILVAAANLATTRGLEGLSIGELAQHIGMSKSGLYAHFKSKEELELATIDTAAEIFEVAVIDAVPELLRGRARVLALNEAFLQHLARRVFPGGCFFAAVAAQLAAQPGRARDRVLQVHRNWGGQIRAALQDAASAGELPRSADLDQVVFEVTAMMLRANFDWVINGDEGVLERARVGVRRILEKVATEPAARRSKSSGRRSTRAGSRSRH